MRLDRLGVESRAFGRLVDEQLFDPLAGQNRLGEDADEGSVAVDFAAEAVGDPFPCFVAEADREPSPVNQDWCRAAGRQFGTKGKQGPGVRAPGCDSRSRVSFASE